MNAPRTLARPTSKKKAYVGIYGNVSLKKAYCEACEGHAIVLSNKLQCCDRRVDEEATIYKRECEPEFMRRAISKADQEAQLLKQENRCLYCEKTFGSHVIKGKRLVRMVVHWDHFIPFAYTQNNTPHNFVAACQICNGIKSSKMFQTIEEARNYIAIERDRKGIS